MFLNKIKFRVANIFLNSSLNQEKFLIDLKEIDYLIDRLNRKINQDYDFPIKVISDQEIIFRLKYCNSHYTLEVSKHQKIIASIRIETQNLNSYLKDNKQK